MDDDALIEQVAAFMRGARYRVGTWADDARAIIAMVRENNPPRGPSKNKDPVSPDAGGGPIPQPL